MSEQTAELVRRLDALLPQTQCRRCGFEACLPYAEALARGTVSPNHCPPGGEHTRRALAAELGLAPEPAEPVHASEPTHLARVREHDCIGCTRCIRACPVDAIVGASGCMHSVVARWCTGCALCVPVCPTDCIELSASSCVTLTPDAARERYRQREARRARRDDGADARTQLVDLDKLDRDGLRAAVAAAVQRSRERTATEQRD